MEWVNWLGWQAALSELIPCVQQRNHSAEPPTTEPSLKRKGQTVEVSLTAGNMRSLKGLIRHGRCSTKTNTHNINRCLRCFVYMYPPKSIRIPLLSNN